MNRTMKAIAHDEYGEAADVLAPREVPVPEPGRGEVRVKVHAVSLNAADVYITRGEPTIGRLAFGWPRPKRTIRGRDVAGVVDSVGPGVTEWSPGDRVAAEGEESLAEYTCVKASLLARVPDGVPLTEAAAVPLAGVTALQAVRVGEVKAGDRVLVNGASGGVGTFIVQLATAAGAEVTGVCGAGNTDLVRSLGAVHVVDYGVEDFTEAKEPYDVVIDLAGNRSLRELRSALAPGGTLVLTSGHGSRAMGPLWRNAAASLTSPFVRQRLRPFLARTGVDGEVEGLLERVAAGTLRPAVGRTYPFERAVDALAHVSRGHARGKVVVVLREG
ncbi:NAD(P)-dependent alcohol dehydrogenase [Nocardiopsis sp. N85]|uniref:NAD(P)-dependent alcohol dehydrogenase n=1 Tax=Nocardiopsis sp. N85 TaxID=3029400 RepID=UPI00237FD03D|nr:NAD(P)-dependent alcohol dehydrogenase [Nocardiopsis sp. N85]MDE3724066.1 NAD(P)-dependent alcohol dehydrogenase [Nocardiopsis sp. N85]